MKRFIALLDTAIRNKLCKEKAPCHSIGKELFRLSVVLLVCSLCDRMSAEDKKVDCGKPAICLKGYRYVCCEVKQSQI